MLLTANLISYRFLRFKGQGKSFVTPKQQQFFVTQKPPTPCLVVDLECVRAQYHALHKALPQGQIYYAIKANPAKEVLETLVAQGSAFDTASLAEIDMALAAGAGPAQISYGNTIKKEVDIAAAYRKGIRLFAFDSEAELRKLARAAPGAGVFCRVLTTGEGADWPLSRKFGCTTQMAAQLLRLAVELGLRARGLSFHVGSQQRDPGQWGPAIASVASVYHQLRQAGIEVDLLNLGGGFTTQYREAVADEFAHAQAIQAALTRAFGGAWPQILIEPGRSLVGAAGIIQTEIVLIAQKGDADTRRWVYLDIGKFGGLAETWGEAIQYPISTQRSGPLAPVILAGPTCDSADILYEQAEYHLPIDIEIGDKIFLHATGAYTTTYASVAFNGFAPLKAYYL
jgi:ornithine decarboxylase